MTSHETPGPPAAIGPYVIEELIGSGGFGEVYRAHGADGRQVAVKRMHPELSDSVDAVLRFEREIRIIERLRHPNVVEILDLGEDGAPFFVMELLHGRDLRDHLREVGRVTPDATLDVLVPLGRALAAAHAQGVVHRDIKPSNVFLDEGRVVLLDFGVAKLLDDTSLQLTSSRIEVGSPPSMAPEQILGRPVDARTDVYGIGLLAYQMLTGGRPFVHESQTVVREMILTAPPPSVSRRSPVRPELDRVICRALSKDPAARQPSVAEFLDDFANAVRGRRRPVGSGASLAVHIESGSDDLGELIRALVTEGMELAFEAGNAATLLLALPAEPEAQRRQRERLLGRLAALCPGSEVSVFVNVGTPAALLRLGAWVPETTSTGVLLAPAALEGLEVATETVADCASVLKLVGSRN